MIPKKKSSKSVKKKSVDVFSSLPPLKVTRITILTKAAFWFITGIVLGSFLIVSFLYFFFQFSYQGKVYPGILVGDVNFGGKTQSDVQKYFAEKNDIVQKSIFTFSANGEVATISGKELGLGYDANLVAKQAYSLGRTKDTVSNISIIIQAYINGINLPSKLSYNQDSVQELLSPIAKDLYKDPVEGRFDYNNGRVTQFQLSQDGQEVDMDKVKQMVQDKVTTLATADSPENFSLAIPLHVLKPQLTSDKINEFGIKELIGMGTSLFQGSDDSRIYNVELGASRLNGAVIKPGEVFSFDQTIGDVSSLSGYKEAYVISGGHTVLGDGGGICQVSTTFFRAALNAGLPIVERHGHDYRVHYYEEDGPPGIDATIYTPTVDLKVKNDTGHAILVQAVVDPSTLRLTVNLYGTSDGRQVTMTTPVVYNQIPAPPPLYQDDPTLPAGQVKQTDFAANGATVSFSRTVTRNGQILIHDTYTTVYRPWQAVFNRGTKTG